MTAHSLPVRVGAHMGRAFLRWLELVINTTTVMLVTAGVGAVLIVVGMVIVGGPVDGDDFEQFFRDIVGSETKTTQAETNTSDDTAAPSTARLPQSRVEQATWVAFATETGSVPGTQRITGPARAYPGGPMPNVLAIVLTGVRQLDPQRLPHSAIGPHEALGPDA